MISDASNREIKKNNNNLIPFTIFNKLGKKMDTRLRIESIHLGVKINLKKIILFLPKNRKQ